MEIRVRYWTLLGYTVQVLGTNKFKNNINKINSRILLKEFFHLMHKNEYHQLFIKEKIKINKIYKSIQLPKRLGVAEAVNSTLDASIYRLPNVGPHFINCIVDPQNSSPNWSLSWDIEISIATEFSVFVVGLCCSMQSSVETCSLSSFLDFVATDFDNVAT